MADPDQIPEADRIEGVPHPRETAHLFGQDDAATAFLSARNASRMHHAWIISGPQGIGKATLAWRLARFTLSVDDTGQSGPFEPEHLFIDPSTPLFRRVVALGEPRIALLRRNWNTDTKKFRNDITVDDVRKLKSFFTLSAADGGWRVAIVDAADDLNKAAANALLKLLEEPPQNTLFFLITHQPGRLLPTIKSRCRTLPCEKLSADALSLALDGAGIPVEPDMSQLREIADGSVGEAINLLRHDGEELYASIIATLGTMPRLDRGRVLDISDACAQRGKEHIYKLTLRLILLALSRLAKTGATGTELAEAAPGERTVMTGLSQNITDGRKWAELAQHIATRTSHATSVNLDPAGVILDTFLQIETAAKRTS